MKAALAIVLAMTWTGFAADSSPIDSSRPQWQWPKRLKELKFGEKVQYRDSEYWVQPVIRKDGESEVVLFRGENEYKRVWTGIGGHFAILDTDTPVPTLEGWCEDIHDHGVRWLLCSFMWKPNQVSYGWTYMELYTTKKDEAHGDEIHRVSRRQDSEPKEYRYYDWAEKYDPKNATDALKLAKTIKG